MSPLKGRPTKMPAREIRADRTQATVPAPLKPLLLVRPEAGATREKGDGSKRGLKEKAKMERGGVTFTTAGVRI